MSLLNEFYKTLNRPYDIMPIVRPTKSNPQAARVLSSHTRETLEKTVALAKSNLQRPESEIPSGVEVVTRPALNPNTRNEDGDRVMWVAPQRKRKTKRRKKGSTIEVSK